MKLYDYDGRPLVGDHSDPLLEYPRAVHGEPPRDHHGQRWLRRCKEQEG